MCRFLDELPEDKRRLFMSLSDCKAGEDEEKTELGIWRTNNFALGRSHSKSSNGIFPTIARFNHSCIPSAEFSWNEKAGKQEIRAIRDIQAQEEITLCYFTSKWQLEPLETRRQYLQDCYGFACNCKVCQPSDAEAAAKDWKKRKTIQNLRAQFDDLVYMFTDLEDDNEELVEPNIDESELNRDLFEALGIGLQRLALMNELQIKCRSRLDFTGELYEVAVDCEADQIKPLIIQRGLDLANTLFGADHDETRVWYQRWNTL